MVSRLNDTEALVRQGLRQAELCTADEPPKPAAGSADRAISGPGTGRYRKETGAGNESLSRAVDITKEC